MSYAELDGKSADFGAWLQAKGLAKGARVAIMMPNVLQYPVAMMAILRAGYTVVNVNPLYTPRELEHQLMDSGARSHRHPREFRDHAAGGDPQGPVKHVIVRLDGRPARPQGRARQFRRRRVKKMVPAWSLPGHVRFKTR